MSLIIVSIYLLRACDIATLHPGSIHFNRSVFTEDELTGPIARVLSLIGYPGWLCKQPVLSSAPFEFVASAELQRCLRNAVENKRKRGCDRSILDRVECDIRRKGVEVNASHQSSTDISNWHTQEIVGVYGPSTQSKNGIR